MSQILIGVVTCEARTAQAAAQRATWVKDCSFDVRFFLAAQDRSPLADEVFMEGIRDDYEGLPAKVRAISRWVLERDYTIMLKMDDDTLCWPSRLVIPTGHYTGWKQAWRDKHEWCAGLAYWLDRPAMEVVAHAELTKQTAEDHWTGTVLREAGILPDAITNGQLQWIGKCVNGVRTSGRLPHDLKYRLSRAYVAGEFTPEEMPKLYV